MPVMGGLELTKLIRRQESENPLFASVPIIGISGNVLPEDAAQAKIIGMNEYVGKPYRFPQIEALMLEYLAFDDDTSLVNRSSMTDTDA